MNFSTKRMILNVLAILLCLLLFILLFVFEDRKVGIPISFTLVVGYSILNVIWWRCPHCKTYLGRLSPFATHCPYCGEKLE